PGARQAGPQDVEELWQCRQPTGGDGSAGHRRAALHACHQRHTGPGSQPQPGAYRGRAQLREQDLNITRFVISKLGDWGPTKDQRPKTKDQHGSASLVFGPSSLVDATLADRWILSRYNSLVGEVDRLMRAYNFGEAGRQIQEFLWSEFADWY